MSSFPPPATTEIDWENLGFKVREVNGHVESHYSRATGTWSPPTFVRDPFLRIHGLAPGLNYGQQAFEGLKAFRQPGDGGGAIALFRPDRNAARMRHSAAVLSMPPPPSDLFLAMVRGAVALNAEFVPPPPHATGAGAAMYVRPVLFGRSPHLALSPPEEHTLAVYVAPTGVYHGAAPARALVLDEFDRAAPNGVGAAKAGGNYAPVMRWSEVARKRGFAITLHLDSKAHAEVDEFSTSGFVGVLVEPEDAGAENAAAAERVTLVVPDGKCAIQSVTSDSVQDIARGFGWKVEKRPVEYHELPCFREVMAAGTAAALVSIRSITRRASATAQSLARASPASKAAWRATVSFADDGENETIAYMPDAQQDAGPRCARLLAQLQGIQRGTLDDPLGWRFEVSEEDGQKMVMEGQCQQDLE